MNSDSPAANDATVNPRWQTLEANQRRVLGVLIEKAKTTPENYPLSLNALRSGCNQKSNRTPLMQLEEMHVEEALDELREVGAVAVVQGGGRIDRYRHLAYEWLGVDKVELAVMAELLLRGAQTVGELRGRAARMEPIKGLSELTPILDSLAAKKLVVYLTPPGRGSVVTHALYLDREMEKVRREAGATSEAAGNSSSQQHTPRAAASPSSSRPTETNAGLMLEQFDALRGELAALRSELEAARNEFAATVKSLRRDLDQLNQQLGN